MGTRRARENLSKPEAPGTDTKWANPGRMPGAIAAAVVGGLIVWGIVELFTHVHIVWR
jgi:hypothetical protein